MAKDEYGTPDNWYDNSDQYTAENANVMNEKITKYMKLAKNCKQEAGCFPDIMYKKIDGNDTYYWDKHPTISRFITSDGMSVFFYSYGSTPINFSDGLLAKSFGAITVDVNGYKKPNVFGRDMFSFTFTAEGIVPSGVEVSSNSTEGAVVFPRACNRTDCYGWCEACAAWVIYNGNLDYLHCDDLSWNGKNKC